VVRLVAYISYVVMYVPVMTGHVRPIVPINTGLHGLCSQARSIVTRAFPPALHVVRLHPSMVCYIAGGAVAPALC